MNEAAARQILLVRAVETPPGLDSWQEEDRDWASRTAVARTGGQGSLEQFITERAGLAAERLRTRSGEVAQMLDGLQWRAWIAPVVTLAAFAFGLLADAVSAERKINILAPPLLTLLGWNLLVYLGLLVNWVSARGRARGRARGGNAPAAEPATRAPGPLTRWLSRLAGATVAAGNRSLPPALTGFVSDWLRLSSPLTTARAHTCLHLAAAAFAGGALAGLYARGLAFEYLAGWDSTFLNANNVHALLNVVLGPASLLTGIGLPDVEHLRTLRLSSAAGENAAPWIHLHAVTIAAGVIIPRLLLAVASRVRSMRLQRHFPLSLDQPYFRALDRRHRGTAAVVAVIPYSYSLSAAGAEALQRLLRCSFGDAVQATLSPALALGAEDALAAHWQPAPQTTLVIVLFAATATPEEEHQGALLTAVRAQLPASATLLVLIDDGAFRRRFGGDPDRVAARQQAWRRLIAHHLDAAPLFISLDASTGDDAAAALHQQLNENATRLGQHRSQSPRGALA